MWDNTTQAKWTNVRAKHAYVKHKQFTAELQKIASDLAFITFKSPWFGGKLDVV